MQYPSTAARHRARPRVARGGVVRPARAAAVVVGIGLVAGVFGVALGLASQGETSQASTVSGVQLAAPDASLARPTTAMTIPVPEQTAVPAIDSVCSLPGLGAALETANTAEAIRIVGGAEIFRHLVAEQSSPCLTPNDPGTIWFVVNKARPFPDMAWEPADTIRPASPNQIGAELRTEAAGALDEMIAAARAEGAGEIALNSGYRSYGVQVDSYGSQVDATGQQEADSFSARPGYSEHQTGLAADLVPCSQGCAALESMGDTAQGQWLAANSWRFGWIVRYEEGYTETTGYDPEPWHLRYIGTDLAALYHDGGYHTLEDFFGLAPAPDYTS